MVRLTDRPDMTLDVYRGRKTTIQQQSPIIIKYSLLTLALMSVFQLKINLLFSLSKVGECGIFISWLFFISSYFKLEITEDYHGCFPCFK